jgi:retron-type reverse transcriptase
VSANVGEWFAHWVLPQVRQSIDLNLRNRTATGRDGQQGRDLSDLSDDELSGVAARCATGEYKFSPYKQLLVIKNANSKPREVAIPQSRDFLVQKILLAYLQSAAPVPSPNAPKLVSELKTVISDGAKFLRLDLTDFYGSIRHDLLERVLSNTEMDSAGIQLVMSAIKTPTLAEGPKRNSESASTTKGVPQGLPISNHLAELFMATFDKAMRELYPGRYFRFVDDILFVTESELSNRETDKIEASLSQSGLSLNKDKQATGDVALGFDYLGYRFTSDMISVRESTRFKYENSLVRNIRVMPRNDKTVATPYVKARWRLNLRITGCVYQGRRIGWLQYFVHLTDLSLLSDFQRMVDRQVALDEKWSGFKPKKFLKVLAILRSPSMGLSSSYIPNFDKHSLEDMKSELRKIFGYKEKVLEIMTPDEVRKAFFREIGREISTLEKEIATNYY